MLPSPQSPGVFSPHLLSKVNREQHDGYIAKLKKRSGSRRGGGRGNKAANAKRRAAAAARARMAGTGRAEAVATETRRVVKGLLSPGGTTAKLQVVKDAGASSSEEDELSASSGDEA